MNFCSYRKKVIGFALSTPRDWLKKLAPIFFIQSEPGVKPKPIVTHSHAFSRALRQLPEITSSFDWFTVLCVLFVIARVIALVLVLRHSTENYSMS